MKKSEIAHFELSFAHSDALALSASLVTECEFICNDNNIKITERADSIIDLRARWNSLMRGLIASEHALSATRGD
jgi:tRNA threonylcarbamoyladenosine modification (KEOPS) complex  Pcc1 subunit